MDFGKGRQAAFFGHPHIKQGEIGTAFLTEINSLLPVCRRGYLISPFIKKRAKHFPVALVVIGHKNKIFFIHAFLRVANPL